MQRESPELTDLEQLQLQPCAAQPEPQLQHLFSVRLHAQLREDRQSRPLL